MSMFRPPKKSPKSKPTMELTSLDELKLLAWSSDKAYKLSAHNLQDDKDNPVDDIRLGWVLKNGKILTTDGEDTNLTYDFESKKINASQAMPVIKILGYSHDHLQVDDEPFLLLRDCKGTLAGSARKIKGKYYFYDNGSPEAWPVKAFVVDKEGVLKGWVNPTGQYRGLEGFKHAGTVLGPEMAVFYDAVKQISIVDADKVKFAMTAVHKMDDSIRDIFLEHKIDTTLIKIILLSIDYRNAFFEGLIQCKAHDIEPALFIQDVELSDFKGMLTTLSVKGIKDFIDKQMKHSADITEAKKEAKAKAKHSSYKPKLSK